MSLHLVRLSECPPQPWRNGGGLTRELLAWPLDAAGWSLRISVADVERSGPFSPLPGIERWFAVVDGAGVALALPGGSVTLGAGSAPLRFDGADAPACTLVDGPTRDLNFMVRHRAGRASMRTADRAGTSAPGALWRGLYSADAVALQLGDHSVELPPATLAWAAAGDGDAAAVWRLAQGGRAWWLTLEP